MGLVRLEHQDYERMVTGIPVKEAAPLPRAPCRTCGRCTRRSLCRTHAVVGRRLLYGLLPRRR
ncbi:MAG: hypothetical protein ACLTYN_04575 [Dysosmobacter welbionis]